MSKKSELEKSIKDKLASTIASLTATLNLQNTQAQQQQQTDITTMQNSVQNDAMRRSMARSSLPVTTAGDEMSRILTQYANAAAERQNTYTNAVNTANQSASDQLLAVKYSGGGGGGKKKQSSSYYDQYKKIQDMNLNEVKLDESSPAFLHNRRPGY